MKELGSTQIKWL